MTTMTREQPDWAELLRVHGFKVTQPRLVVLETLHRNPHSSADEIVRYADPRPATLSVQSVYNVLADLGRERLVRSLELPNQPARFELDNGDNHHHAVCVDCGMVTDVPCAVGETPCLTPSHDHGMAIEIADVLYRGRCRNCLDKLNQPDIHQEEEN